MFYMFYMFYHSIFKIVYSFPVKILILKLFLEPAWIHNHNRHINMARM